MSSLRTQSFGFLLFILSDFSHSFPPFCLEKGHTAFPIAKNAEN
ncbi:unknown protein [Simkania negevensis Z]|uniref:Uncharacterized protein n=1 Tax=Simkania negevensis (strain ATCC VR-1471 / DSM 27360 / Z) TaxID=331113 RepID=F8L7H3_SIMNZ|nr:unknown protein [Simkania negevensis Z]